MRGRSQKAYVLTFCSSFFAPRPVQPLSCSEKNIHPTKKKKKETGKRKKGGGKMEFSPGEIIGAIIAVLLGG